MKVRKITIDELMLYLIDEVNEEISKFNEKNPDFETKLTSLGGVLQRRFRPLLHSYIEED